MSGELINSRLQGMRREELIAELAHAHSEEFVLMFLGWLCGELPELHTFECPKMLVAWGKFKTEMGK